MSIITFISLVSSCFTIIGFFYSDFFNRHKSLKWLASLIVLVLAIFITTQAQRLERILNINDAAKTLVDKYDNNEFNNYKGYIQAGLAFLDAHKDKYPDSYERAKMIYDRAQTEWYTGDLHSSADEIRDLLYGISVMNQ